MRTEGRECGDCTVCCTYLRIRQPGQLVKLGLTPCEHLAPGGSEDGYTGASDCGSCGIYEARPDVCKGYRCSWLDGYGDDEDRPDRSGVLIDRVLPIANCLQAKPIRAGAGDSNEGNAAIERMSRSAGRPVLVARFPETAMVRVVGRGAE